MDKTSTDKISIHLDTKNISLDIMHFNKMVLLYNAIEEGWSIRKREESYIFTKKHEGKKEIISDTYLMTFMKSNLDIRKILSE
jgi:hypothetical protein